MSETPDSVYESTYRNTPFAAIALVAIVATGAAAAYMAVTRLSPDDMTLVILEIAAVTIAAVALAAAASFRRHCWRAGPNALAVQERPKFRVLGLSRDVTVPYADITALRRIESGFDSMLELETSSGVRHVLSPAMVRSKAGALGPDHDGFNGFANVLRKRIKSAGSVEASFLDGLGFWNRGLGLGLLISAFLLTLGLSGLIVYALMSGVHMPQGAAMQGLGIVLLLPVAVGYALYGSLVRRSFVLGLPALRDKIRAKEEPKS